MDPKQTTLQRFGRIVTYNLLSRTVGHFNSSVNQALVSIEIPNMNISSPLSTHTFATLQHFDGAGVVL